MKTFFRSKFVRVSAALLACLVLAVVGLIGRAQWLANKSYADVPAPPIVADVSPTALARGEMLFQSLCMECHAGADGNATGKYLDEVPAFLGTFYSANLAHPEHGVLKRSDAELARVLRFGVLPDGRLSAVMNGFGHLADSDVAALLGYMRSGASVFAPTGTDQPRTEISMLGSAILTYVAKVNVERPLTGVTMPPKAPTEEYGHYMVQAMDCVGCHTDGFSSTKLTDEGAFAGGFELTDPTGTPIFTKNITFDEATGIGRWSVDDLERAVTRGVTPEGLLVRKPMPTFTRLDRTDIEAIYKYLQTVPKVNHPNRAGGHPLEKAHKDDPPEALFVNVGCVTCHGETGPFRDKLRAALDKSDGDVASWILDPQKLKPGSPMPSFERSLDLEQATKLAQYVKTLARSQGG